MQGLAKAVDKHRDLILKTEKFIWEHPETGYREKETSKYMEDTFIALGYDIVKAEGITGFYADIDTGKPGPQVLILGELDSIICPSHKSANPQTGAVHACGHNAQCAALVGIAAALKEPGIMDKFCGKIKLCAVPAEELLELDFRSKLKKDGVIKYFEGKTEFLSRGYFDGVDIAFMVHTSISYSVTLGAVGAIAKRIAYKGVSSHAGGSPQRGINALYAANCGINAINAIRETFRERDIIRVHPIITHGGEIVNAIPELVEIESYVRGSNFDAIAEANKKVNRALTGAALSLGANIEIIDSPAFSPLNNDKNMMKLAEEAAKLAVPQYEFTVNNVMGSGSTDMGDLSSIMPVVHPYAGGGAGKAHGNDYEITDPDAACVENAKWQLAMLLLLLQDGGKRAKQIIDEYEPAFASKDEFLAYVDALNCSGDRIVYNEDGTAQVRIN